MKKFAVAASIIVCAIAPVAFAVDCPAAIASVTPASGPVSGGTLVTITAADGSSFGGCVWFEAPIPIVEFDGVPLYVVGFPNVGQVQVVTPYHVPGPVDVTVKSLVASGTAPHAFTYIDAPSIPAMSTIAMALLVLAISVIAFVRLR